MGTYTTAHVLAWWAVKLVGTDEDMACWAWEWPGPRPAQVPVAACGLQ
jgi:hypothetical protein